MGSMRHAGSSKNVFMIEDHLIFREAVAGIINQDRRLTVCGGSGDGRDALERIRHLSPDVILLDIALPGIGGIELTRQIRARHPRVRILMLSMYKASLSAERALRAGANGYVMKREDGRTLLAAIHAVLEGKTVIGREGLERVRQAAVQSTDGTSASLECLSDREMEVYQRVGQGLPTREIASLMQISVKTVESHKGRIRSKLDLGTNGELFQQAIHWVHSEGAPD